MNKSRNGIGSISFWVFIGVLVIAIVAGLTYIIRQGGGSIPVIGQAPSFSATNVDGKSVSMTELNGKIRLVTWFYTRCPDECPLTAYRMEQIQNQLNKDGTFGSKVAFISMTFDPNYDTLPVLRKWSERYHPDYNGWYFLRTNQAATSNILHAWGVQKRTTDTEYIEHVIKTDLIDQNGNIRRTYTSADLDVNQVVSDIHNLISRSSWTS